MLNIFVEIISVGGIFCTLIGVVTVFYWAKSPKKPSDASNRINNITSWWIGLTRPDVLANQYKYFRQDVLKNIQDVNKTNRIDE